MKLFNRNFLLLWQGQLVSTIGNQMFSLALLYWLLEVTGSATTMGLIMMASTLPVVLVALPGGTLADILPRKTLLIVSDLVQGTACLVFVASLFLLKPSHSVVALFVLVFTMGVASAVFKPAMRAALPDLVPPDRLQSATSLMQASGVAVGTIGAAAGGFLYMALGAPILFLINGLSFLFSAATECFLKIPHRRSDAPMAVGNIGSTLLSSTRAGLDYVRGQKGLLYLVCVISILNMTAAPLTVSMPIFVRDGLGSDITWLGLLAASQGVGAFIGLAILSAVKFRPAHRPWIVGGAQIGLGLLLALTVFFMNRYAALALLGLYGLLLPFFNVITQTVILSSTPSEIRGRVISVLTLLSAGLMPVAMGLSGIVIDLINQDIRLLWLTTATVYLVLGALFMGQPSIRKYMST